MSKRKQWDRKNMESAIRAVQAKEMGYLQAAKAHSVPVTTLKRMVKMVRDEVS